MINVLGKKVPITTSKTLASRGIYGLYDAGAGKIEVDVNIKGDMLKRTIIHETIHAMFDRLGSQMDFQLEEIYCDSIANVIVENFNVSLKCKMKK